MQNTIIKSFAPLVCALMCAFASVASAGDLLVAAWRNDRILRLNPTTGEYIADLPGPGVARPRDMLIGPDGMLYVASGDGTIKRFNPQTGASLGFFALPSNPYGMALGSDGNLYVGCDDETSAAIYRCVPSTGEVLGQFSTAPPELMRHPGDLEFGPDGDLYVTAGSSGKVLRFDGQTGNFNDVFAQVVRPTSLLFDAAGTLYVTDAAAQNSGLLYQFAPDGSVLRTAFTEESPSRMTFGPHGLIYITGHRYAGIQRVDPATWTWGYGFGSAGGYEGASALVFVPEPSCGMSAVIVVFACAARRRIRKSDVRGE